MVKRIFEWRPIGKRSRRCLKNTWEVLKDIKIFGVKNLTMVMGHRMTRHDKVEKLKTHRRGRRRRMLSLCLNCSINELERMWMDASLSAFDIQSLGLPEKTDNGGRGPY